MNAKHDLTHIFLFATRSVLPIPRGEFVFSNDQLVHPSVEKALQFGVAGWISTAVVRRSSSEKSSRTNFRAAHSPTLSTTELQYIRTHEYEYQLLLYMILALRMGQKHDKYTLRVAKFAKTHNPH